MLPDTRLVVLDVAARLASVSKESRRWGEGDVRSSTNVLREVSRSSRQAA